MKFIDPNGHLYVGRYLDDGYSRDYYLAKLPAPKSQPTPSCTSSPDVCLSRGGNSQYTPMPVSGSPDRFLTNLGINQYDSSTSEATPTASSPTTGVYIPARPGRGWRGSDPPSMTQVGAGAATVLLGALSVASFLAAVIIAPVSWACLVGVCVSEAFFAAGIGLAAGTFLAGQYTYEYGPNAKPEGAFAASGADIVVETLEQLLGI